MIVAFHHLFVCSVVLSVSRMTRALTNVGQTGRNRQEVTLCRPIAKGRSERSDNPPPGGGKKVTFLLTVQVLTSWISSVYEIELMQSSSDHVDSSFDYKVTSSIIILKIEVSPRQPLGTPIFKPWKRSKIWGKRPSVIRRLATGLHLEVINFWFWSGSGCWSRISFSLSLTLGDGHFI